VFVSEPKFTKLLSSNVEKIVVANAFFRPSIAQSVPEIFVIEVEGCPKSSTLLVTHEPLHLIGEILHARLPRKPLEPY